MKRCTWRTHANSRTDDYNSSCGEWIDYEIQDLALDERWPYCPYCGGRLTVDDREGPERKDKMEAR